MSTKKLFLRGEKKEALVFVLVSFIAWRVWLQVFLWLGWFVLPLGDDFLVGGLENFLRNPGLWAWANFDGEHYLAIAQHGYGSMEQAFFPLFPFLIKSLPFLQSKTLFNLLLSGLMISHLAFFVALVILYFLVRIDFGKKTAQWTIILLLVFPTSFFFAGVYTESVFLLLVVSSFYAARKGQWWLAGILGALASATRLVGIFLLPALLWEWWEQNKMENGPPKAERMANWLNLIAISLIPLGLVFYMRDLAIHYQDPLMFLHSQPAFGAQRVVDKIILLYQVFWRYGKMIMTTKINFLYFTVWLELICTTTFLVLLIFAFFKKIRLSYLIFAGLAFIIPTITGTFLSMPRFILVLFPGFIVISLIKSRVIRYLWLVLSLILLIVCTIFFTRGFWIA